MPKISEFYGISIFMYYRDHPPPHFHAQYAGQQVLISIDSGDVISGTVPSRALGMVREWAKLRRAELAADWERARRQEPLEFIDPLP